MYEHYKDVKVTPKERLTIESFRVPSKIGVGKMESSKVATKLGVGKMESNHNNYVKLPEPVPVKSGPLYLSIQDSLWLLYNTLR